MNLNVDAWTCPFNVGVTCYDKHKCWRCGWFPKVAAERKAEIRRQIKGWS